MTLTRCRAAVLVAVLLVLLGGCASLEGWLSQEQFLDHAYKWTILPSLLDGYERKTTFPHAPIPHTPVPADLDRG